MRELDYSYLTPKLYYWKSKLLNFNSYKSIIETNELEKIISILEQSGIKISGEKSEINVDMIATQIEKFTLSMIEEIIKIAPEETSSLIGSFYNWLNMSALLSVVKIYQNKKNISYAGFILSDETFSKLKKGIDSGSVTLNEDPNSIALLMKYFFGYEIVAELGKYKQLAEQSSCFSLYQILGTMFYAKKIKSAFSEIDTFNYMMVRELLGAYMDMKAVEEFINAHKMCNDKKSIEHIALEYNGFFINGKDISNSLISGSYESSFELLASKLNIKSEKDEKKDVSFNIKRKIRNLAEHQFGKYPFSPALSLGYVLLLLIQRDNLMSILIGKSSNISEEIILENLVL
ncbi:MAG: V-type ATPase subunit [Fervidicoccus fontis]